MNARDHAGQPEGLVTTPDQLQCRAATVLLVKHVADTLERNYPGWLWAVRPNEQGGVIVIYSLRISGHWGYLLKLSVVQADTRLNCVLKAGGEILERCGFPRGAYNRERWLAAKRKYGMVDFDISDKDARIQRRRRDDDLTCAVKQGRVQLQYKDTPFGNQTFRQLWIKESVTNALLNRPPPSARS